MPRRILLTVKPRVRREAVIEVAKDAYQASVHAAPFGGEANQRVIELLAEYFSVPKSRVHIIRGRSARKKLVEIR